jgi:hypothetical protein
MSCNNCQDVSGNDCPKTKQYFDFDYYRCWNPDVAKVYGSDNKGLWKHWCNYGYSECRIHRFVVPWKECTECCPKKMKVVCEPVHVKFCDQTIPPCPPQACEPCEPCDPCNCNNNNA